MAAITPQIKNDKVVAYRFRACVGRDTNGKQIFRSYTWKVPAGMTPSKAERTAYPAAEQWEKEVRAEHEKDLESPERIRQREIAHTHTDFVRFVWDEWFPICVYNGENKPKTVSYYNDTAKNITAYFNGRILQAITPAQLQKFLIYLRTEKNMPHRRCIIITGRSAESLRLPYGRSFC